MSLDTFDVTRPGSLNGGVDPLETMIEEFTGIVEGTLKRRSVTKDFVNIRSVKGTSTVTNRSVGQSAIGVVAPGTTPDSTSQPDFGKNSVTIDRVIYARSAVPLLDEFQLDFDARKEIANEHGKTIAKFMDQAFFVQGLKAARLSTSPFGSDGHLGGTVETLAAAGDQNDPAKLYSAFARLFAAMEEKDVHVVDDGCCIFVRPSVFYTLIQSEQVINGTSVKGHIFEAWGVPVKSTANLINTNIQAATPGSIAAMMGSAYEVDATNLAALVLAPKAILAGENIALRSDVFYDKLSKSWYIDAELAFNATPNRTEFAGAIHIAP
jgi:hypothetical protein